MNESAPLHDLPTAEPDPIIHAASTTRVIITEALRLARAGFHVGITSPGEKRPHPELMCRETNGQAGGVWKATIDVDAVNRWWSSCPNGNLFVASRGQLVALDIDNPSDFENHIGRDFVEDLRTCYPCTQTPSGGFHFWFNLPPETNAKNLPRKLLHGEFIYEGFYALVPPSRAASKDGEIREYSAVIQLPDRIQEVPEIPQEHLSRILDTAIHHKRGVEKGQRHNTLLETGLELAREGLDAASIAAALHKLNSQFVPPMNAAELQSEIDGVIGWVKDKNPLMPIAGNTSSKVSLLSMKQLAELPTPRWLIPNLFLDAGLGFLISPPGGGKSFLLLTVAMAVCRGIPLFGDKELMPARKGWVLLLLPEASRSWSIRIQSYCQYYNLEYSDDFVCCIQQNDLSDPTTWRRVFAATQEQVTVRGCPPVLVIVDTLSASIPGKDENSTIDMTMLMSHLQMAISAWGACVIVAHHPTKYTPNYRGSSTILGSCDWMISIIRSGDAHEFQAVKLRDASEITSRAFEIRVYGESAVCVGRGEPGPWGLFDCACKRHPELRQVLVSHGFEIPGEQRIAPSTEDICLGGTSLSSLQSTWNKLQPITPCNADDPKGYKAAHGARTTALLGVIEDLLKAGVLKVVDGEHSRGKRRMKTVVRQVRRDED